MERDFRLQTEPGLRHEDMESLNAGVMPAFLHNHPMGKWDATHPTKNMETRVESVARDVAMCTAKWDVL
jgi:hypothetical protein